MTTRDFPLTGPAVPERPRLGLVVPATDEVSEASFLDMLDGHEVAFVTSRVAFENPVTMSNLARMVDDLTRATALLLPGGRIDAVVFSCTSATVAAGVEAVRRSIQAARPGMPFTTPITAAVVAFERLGTRRIAVLTPYLDEVNEGIHGFLTGHGLDVRAFGSFHLRTEPEIARVPVEAIVRAARALDDPGVEALFISCTGMRAHAAIARLEADLGKPVVTSNQAQLWQALSLIGYQRPLTGFGRLWERSPDGAPGVRHPAQLAAD